MNLAPFFRTILPAALVGILAACGSSTVGPGSAETNLGILQIAGIADGHESESDAGGEPDTPVSWDLPPGEEILFPPEVLRAPKVVLAGRPFDLTVFTLGPDGCWSPESMDLSVGGGVLQLTPWDRHSGSEVCTMIFGYLRHDAVPTLPTPGEWTVRVEGRRVRADGTTERTVRAEGKILAVEASQVATPVTLQLPIGTEVLLEGSTTLLFEAVEGDSRCAVDVQCVWAGNAGVRLRVQPAGGAPTTLLLNTGVEPRSGEAGGYRFELLDLDPDPMTTALITPGSYRATLRIETP